MPPKVKIAKEDIVNIAVEIVRNNGADAINARTIATKLNCSTQPIFSNFATMDELRFEVVKQADKICYDYISKEIEGGRFPKYKASGMAYIGFANDEKELFKLLYMRDRSNESDPVTSVLDSTMNSIVHNSTGLDEEKAKLFHFEMWAFVHGIATMYATSFVKLDLELVSRMLTDAYLGLRKQYGLE